jgi:DNA-directed RNA polymerase subunit RPC12/RpoP
MAMRTSSANENLLGMTIRCEKCGGYAFLVRCVLDARERSEMWIYEGADCGRKFVRSMTMQARRHVWNRRRSDRVV